MHKIRANTCTNTKQQLGLIYEATIIIYMEKLKKKSVVQVGITNRERGVPTLYYPGSPDTG